MNTCDIVPLYYRRVSNFYSPYPNIPTISKSNNIHLHIFAKEVFETVQHLRKTIEFKLERDLDS